MTKHIIHTNNSDEEKSKYENKFEKRENTEKEVTKTFISGQNSCTLIIPKSVALEYGLISPSHVVVERTDKGILIRKLEL